MGLFHSIWSALLKAFATHVRVQRCCLTNVFTHCVKRGIANRSNRGAIFLCPPAQNWLPSFNQAAAWFAFSLVVYTWCCHMNLANRSDRAAGKCPAETRNVGMGFEMQLVKHNYWRSPGDFLRNVYIYVTEVCQRTKRFSLTPPFFIPSLPFPSM